MDYPLVPMDTNGDAPGVDIILRPRANLNWHRNTHWVLQAARAVDSRLFSAVVTKKQRQPDNLNTKLLRA